MSDVLPDNGGYVAAAYLVFLTLILIYVAIMAVRLARLERTVIELNDLADRREATSTPEAADAGADGSASAREGTPA